MKAFVIDRYKPADGGHLADVADPRPGAGQVLVEVHAAGVNPLDVRIRSGEFKLFLRHHMPLILGNDVAGVVPAVGPTCPGSRSATRCTPAPSAPPAGSPSCRARR